MSVPSIQCGHPFPLGAQIRGDGVNFALFSRHAQAVELLLYLAPGDAQPASVHALDPQRNRTGDIWHIWVPGIRAGQAYAYRLDGPYRPEEGLLFDRDRVLIDPRAGALAGVAGADFGKALVTSAGDDGPFVPRAVVADREFAWRGDAPPRTPWSQTIVYETHVRGLTIAPSAGVAHPGTYRGLVEKIPYFRRLGVTAIELLPVQEAAPLIVRSGGDSQPRSIVDYWGYSPVALFAPKASLAPPGLRDSAVEEFKRMVRALHQARIEVILDIVVDHTGEGDERGPTVSYRGLDNPIYYILSADRRGYADFSGCGNTLNCNHPVVRDHILDCLRHWVVEMHVDGFRFDLASLMGRDESGAMLRNPPILRAMAEDPVLRNVKLIAEAWDAAGICQLGSFGDPRWSEWNGRFRDDVRRFWRGDRGLEGAFASRLCGSADLFAHEGKAPVNSINFVACHDGLTLNDVVSYARKHNEANDSDNHDGAPDDFSANYGVEGETRDLAIEATRVHQIKNLLATLLLSRGVPMLLGGDEFRRTQRGNNNAYCQDNEISWYDWELLGRHREIFEFARGMIAFRRSHPVVSAERFYEPGELTWFDQTGQTPDWRAESGVLGCLIRVTGIERALCLLANARDAGVRCATPEAMAGACWRAVIDTAAPAPTDLFETWADAPVRVPPLNLEPRSLLVLEEQRDRGSEQGLSVGGSYSIGPTGGRSSIG